MAIITTSVVGLGAVRHLLEGGAVRLEGAVRHYHYLLEGGAVTTCLRALSEGRCPKKGAVRRHFGGPLLHLAVRALLLFVFW